MNVDKNLKQTFRLLKEVVRETKLRAGPFSESGSVILSYEGTIDYDWKDSAFLFIRHYVDVRD